MAKQKNPFMTYIDDFDMEAAKFLTKYGLSEAIYTPIPIPIWDIATKKMTLDIVQTENLSSDGSVHGAIAFTKGIIEIYDWLEDEYIGYEVKKGTVFLDSDLTNEGRINNTLAHECFHWYKHRQYFVYRCSHENGVEFGFRCDEGFRKRDNQSLWADEEKMEWQARNIAPKILMPKSATKVKVEELYQQALKHSSTADIFSVTKSVIIELATFFHVSKQSAAIRMTELGYNEASNFFTYDDEDNLHRPKRLQHHTNAKQQQQAISPVEAFNLYCTNDYLRTIVNTGVFCFADGYFVIQNNKYISSVDNSIHLTEYAQNHLSECTLNFSTRLIGNTSNHGTSMNMMYRMDIQYKKLHTFDSTAQNTDMYNKAKALEKVSEDFEKQFELGKSLNPTANQQFWKCIQVAHWNSNIFQNKTLLNAMDYSSINVKIKM